MAFDTKKETRACISWIQDWFSNCSGGAKGIVLGISGGKDSTVAANLCAQAIGVEKVLGILLPNGVQCDLEDAEKVAQVTGIKSKLINIINIYEATFSLISNAIGADFKKEAQINITPRLRMCILYAVAQSYSYRVCGTSNLSERYIGYTTKWGDSVSDFNPVGNFTSDEVIKIGCELGLPSDLIYKTPADGLCGKSDEDTFGFTYKELNEYIRTGTCKDEAVKNKIDTMNKISAHKREVTPMYKKKTE